MTEVLLFNPPGDSIRTGRLVRRSKSRSQSWPPIFLAYATGWLEKQGYECKLYDASISKDTYNKTSDLIQKWNPEVIAYYWSYDTRVEDLIYAEYLAKNHRLILVGPWSAHYPNALNNCPSVEAMTFGQFEFTLPKLIEGKYAEGVTYHDGIHIPQRDPYTTSELDSIPYVTDVYRRHLDIRTYHQTSFRHPFIDLFSSRDCPHRCTFCSWVNGMYQLHPQRWQKRSINNVLDELWQIKEKLPWVKQVFFQDSTLVTSWAREISQALLDEGLDLCWGAYSRADKDYETLKLMKAAGCLTLHVGYEVPIQSILDEIQKDITVEQESQFIKDVNKLGLWTSSSFMIFPWMTPDQIQYMVRWIKENGATRINVAQLQAYPNCPIMDTLKTYQDKHLMDFNEMKRWEQYCFKEFYLKNPRFWWNVITNPRELRRVVKDGWGLLRFLAE